MGRSVTSEGSALGATDRLWLFHSSRDEANWEGVSMQLIWSDWCRRFWLRSTVDNKLLEVHGSKLEVFWNRLISLERLWTEERVGKALLCDIFRLLSPIRGVPMALLRIGPKSVAFEFLGSSLHFPLFKRSLFCSTTWSWSWMYVLLLLLE